MERKIIKSNFGIAIAVLNVVLLIGSFFAAIYYAYLYSKGDFYSSMSEENIMKMLGFSSVALVSLQNKGDEYYVLLSVGCYLISCLPPLFVHIKAMKEPSYAAGSPQASVRISICNLGTNFSSIFLEILAFDDYTHFEIYW